MARKLLNDVDGFTVDEHAGTFTGSFDVHGVDARYLAYDDEVLIVVRARVKPPRLKESKDGEITRVNVLEVKEAGVVRSDRLKQHLCETLGLETPSPQLPLEGESAKSAEPEPQAEIVQDVVDSPASETEVDTFSPEDLERDPEPRLVPFRPDPGPSTVERRLVSSTRDARLTAFLSEGA